MRSLCLSLTLLAALGLAVLTPGQASAWGRVAYYGPAYYGGSSYYVPSYGATTYYTPSYYAPPVVSSYYAPAYGVAPAAASYYENYSYSPGYSGYYQPRYDRSFRAWAPGGYYVYP